ncbi:hypothetical protein [Indiicoccus explosivorum]|uniref:hypothetical protein n=1 Tax=Indiicoccus explosivorum TaxID=1917864 RepID=UPI000B443FD7|nr:hypothetical protein [Indiicoccus explosivorum]
MKKWLAIILMGTLLAACSGEDVTRITVTEVRTGETAVVIDETYISEIEEIVTETEWTEEDPELGDEPPDYEVTLFTEVDENMPERLDDYGVWLTYKGMDGPGIIVDEKTGKSAVLTQGQEQTFHDAYNASEDPFEDSDAETGTAE